MELDLKKELKRHVPIRELHYFVAEKTGKEPKCYVTKEELITKIEELIDKDLELSNEVKKLLVRYKFAGKGSISWSIPISSSSINISKEDIENRIKQGSHGDPFSSELRPSITKEPALNRAQWLRDNLLKLEFVYADRAYFIEENYEIKEVIPTRHIAIFIRLLNTTFIIESRASFVKSHYFHNVIAELLNIDVGILGFTDNEIENLKMCLGAKKKAARHKRSAGDIDTIEVSASMQIDDLDNSREYQSLLSGDELRKARYKFKYHISGGPSLDVTIYISRRGSIWFVSEVPEEVIDYVFHCVRRIKRI